MSAHQLQAFRVRTWKSAETWPVVRPVRRVPGEFRRALVRFGKRLNRSFERLRASYDSVLNAPDVTQVKTVPGTSSALCLLEHALATSHWTFRSRFERAKPPPRRDSSAMVLSLQPRAREAFVRRVHRWSRSRLATIQHPAVVSGRLD